MAIRAAVLLTAMLLAAPVPAHVGSPDIFFEGSAGPYKLLVTIRPPQVIPGIAEIEIRSLSTEVREVHVVPLWLTEKEPLAPVPDQARASRDDPQFYTGSLWLMATGSWKVRVDVDGTLGKGTLAVPVAALSTRVLGMQTAVGALLLPLGMLLVFGMIGLVGAAVREAQLPPGASPSAARRRNARYAMLAAAMLLAVVVWGGAQWWKSAARDYASYVYKPLAVKTHVEDGSRLVLQFDDPGWLDRTTDDLLPDHGHLMHLYVIHLPEMDRVWHLHPERGEGGAFKQQLPTMPAGRYVLYGDIVHDYGIGETVTAQVELPEIYGKPLQGDDAESGPLGMKANYNPVVSELPGGYRMVWEGIAQTIHARRPYEFRFRLQDAAGQPAADMELYMGMAGHAAFVAADTSVFAHVHPSGSVPMAALGLAQPDNPHAGHMMAAELPSQVSFPYGFPKPGAYRIFVQMKRAGQVLTGGFTAKVED